MFGFGIFLLFGFCVFVGLVCLLDFIDFVFGVFVFVRRVGVGLCSRVG